MARQRTVAMAVGPNTELGVQASPRSQALHHTLSFTAGELSRHREGSARLIFNMLLQRVSTKPCCYSIRAHDWALCWRLRHLPVHCLVMPAAAKAIASLKRYIQM